MSKKVEKNTKNSPSISKQEKERRPDSTKKVSKSDLIIRWEADRFEDLDRHPNWHIFIFVGLVGFLTYSLFTDNLLLSVIIILSGLLIYLFEKMPAKTFKFGISLEGVLAHDRLYEFSKLESFWIFYEPEKNGRKELSLQRKGKFLTHVHIPLGKTDPNKVREILKKFLPEEEHDETVFDALEKFL